LIHELAIDAGIWISRVVDYCGNERKSHAITLS